MIELYTDGACCNNTSKIGAWAFIAVIDRDKDIRDSDYCYNTTNNRMEIQAVIEGLDALRHRKGPITVYSDSRYVVNAMNRWIKNWKKNKWKRKTRKGEEVDVLNIDLWQELDELNSHLNIKYKWVRGHSGNYYNEICDDMCAEQISRL